MKLVRRLKGFNLIETAIVLGIVGLIIGGIWVAAAEVQKRAMVKDITDTMSLSLNAMKTYSPSLSGTSTYITMLLSNLPYPGIWKYDSSGSGNFNGPGISYNIAASKGAGTFYISFFTGLTELPQPAYCNALAKFFFTQPFNSNGTVIFYSIATYPIGTWSAGSAIPDPATVATWCKTASFLQVANLTL